MSDDILLREFIKAVSRLGDTVVYPDLLEQGPPTLEISAGLDDSPSLRRRWTPAVVATDRAPLVKLYEILPSHFPPLYERLVLSYRWLEVELEGFLTLLANPLDPVLASLSGRITADPAFVEVLFPLGFIPFAKANGSYDPVCFDTRRRIVDGDCGIVRIEHEAVLCHGRIGDQWEMAESFRSLVSAVVAKAGRRSLRHGT